LDNPQTFTITVNNPHAQFSADAIIGPMPLFVTFVNDSKDASKYTWSFDDGAESIATDISHTFSKARNYSVKLVAMNDLECIDSTTKDIIVYDLTIPNVFSPNGDNINDVFIINSTGIASIAVEIYNRWGTKIYEWNSLKGGWDGRSMVSGLPCEEGTYYYIVKEKDIFGKTIDKTGFITLVR
jgi:gliding motility-associated-like protein